MLSLQSKDFKKQLTALPAQIQEQAKHRYQQWKLNPHHEWKPILAIKGLYSVPVSKDGSWRALAVYNKESNACEWVFIGNHNDYDRMIKATHSKKWVADIARRIDARIDERERSNSPSSPNDGGGKFRM